MQDSADIYDHQRRQPESGSERTVSDLQKGGDRNTGMKRVGSACQRTVSPNTERRTTGGLRQPAQIAYAANSMRSGCRDIAVRSAGSGLGPQAKLFFARLCLER